MGRVLCWQRTNTHSRPRPYALVHPTQVVSTSTYFDAYTLSASLHQHGEERYRKRSDGRTDIQGFELDSYGLWAQFEKDHGNTKTVYGASYLDRADSYRNDWNADGSFKESKIQGALGDDGTYHLLGAFF